MIPVSDIPEEECTQCGYYIDPDTCWCGAAMEEAGEQHDNHSAIPTGCRCGYAR